VKEGALVFVKPLQSRGQVLSFSRNKGEVEVLCGTMKMHCKLRDLQIIGDKRDEKEKVKIIKNIPLSQPVLEINVLGLTVEEALYEVDNFIDKAVTDNLEEIKVIHGVGTGKLKKAISAHLARHKNVESFRLGKYGEGESGVTIIKLR
ncbi:MAG: Smr/MutS family protein, partial [Clostridia bacterium]|nr:Smr/MutS family protein [Clostridia bacterium]